MKKITRALIIGGTALLVIGAGITGVSAMNNDPETVTDTVKTDSFDELDIDVGSADIVVKAGSENSVYYITEKGLEPKISQNGGKLSISAERRKKFGIHFGADTKNIIEITVAKDELKNISAKTGSGDLELEDLSFEGAVETKSGDISIEDCSGSSLKLGTGSGDIEMNDCSFDKLNKKQGSGDAELTDVTSDEMVLTAKSGSTDLRDCKTGSFSHQSSSGDLKVSGSEMDTADIKAKSGDVELKLNNSRSSFDYELKVSSGDIKFGGSKIGECSYNENNNAGKAFKAETSSGNIELSFE